MPLDPAKVGLAVQNGLSVVCATCPRYWEGRDRGLPDPTCTATSPCGSPLGGNDFSSYAGPMNLREWCFRCGSPSTHLVVLSNPSQRQIGVCSEHVVMFRDLVPNKPFPVSSLLFRGSSGIVRPDDIIPKRRKSFIASILEYERAQALET